ncbi:hypothetical protein DC487_13540 [Sphingobacterium corticibacter]|uniref:DUF4249 domain-containing protein n=2 Tax=Sphingobacterium corticibacter TaxID=2171749 RepID=A0A2T8HGW6_9SPHI|nr:hypothetical protein DC487_13540 [Sphingobacterium corticibacter]
MLAALLGTISCTKNELIGYDRQPENRILSFRITNNSQPIVGAIDQVSNSIKLYIPYYSNLDYLIADVTLDEGATLHRADSTEINLLEDELEPIPVGDSVTYIVRSSEGQYRTYVLTQEVLPHRDALSILGYGNNERRTAFGFKLHTPEDGTYETIANQVFYTFGNFLSSSHRATFTLTNQQTGEVHTDYVRSLSVAPQAQEMYVMTARVVPEALFGTYNVQLEHQGRTTVLPPMKIAYRLPYTESYSSSTKYAVGDTIKFESADGTYPKPERVYMRINPSTRAGDVPAGFAESFYGREIPMTVVSSDRASIKVILPEIPIGVYKNFQANVINLFAVFAPEEGFVANTPFQQEVKLAIPSSGGFQILAKGNID